MSIWIWIWLTCGFLSGLAFYFDYRNAAEQEDNLNMFLAAMTLGMVCGIAGPFVFGLSKLVDWFSERRP